MKHFKLCILVPTTGMCRAPFTFSLANLVMYYAQNQIYEGVQDQYLNIEPIEGSGISANRERLVAGALTGDTTHILFIDEDMSFSPETLHILASSHKPIVGCNYKMRVPGKGFTALGVDKKQRIITDEHSTGLEECHYTGFGFCLIERWVFEKVDRPWFLIGYNTEVHTYTTEDAGFARRVEEANIAWYVDHEASKKVLHWGNIPYSWKEHDYGK
jgi:hypothetical protein